MILFNVLVIIIHKLKSVMMKFLKMQLFKTNLLFQHVKQVIVKLIMVLIQNVIYFVLMEEYQQMMEQQIYVVNVVKMM